MACRNEHIGVERTEAVSGKGVLVIVLVFLALIAVCCVGILIGGALVGGGKGGTQPALPTQERSPTVPAPVPSTVPSPVLTVSPHVPPPATPSSGLPPDDDLRALVTYANAVQPLLEEAGVLVERDGEILEQAQEGNDGVLCDGRLAADNAAMQDLLRGVEAITPPADAAVIRDLMLQSGEAWTEALDNVELFCETGNELYKIPAALKVYEAGATLQDAANRFALLLAVKGVEDWVQR